MLLFDQQKARMSESTSVRKKKKRMIMMAHDPFSGLLSQPISAILQLTDQVTAALLTAPAAVHNEHAGTYRGWLPVSALS
jgi:hypothetical protein